MSELDDAMLQYMRFIVASEKRPFSYHDFLKFEVNGQEYGMAHGTFRNKISKLINTEKVELSYYSSCAFYTLKGHRFGKVMTPNRMVVHNNPFYKMLQYPPFDKQSIHDIRLRFKVPNIWNEFSVNSSFHSNKRNKDIVIPAWNKDNAIIKILIHKTDVVSIIISCSLQPIPLDANGIIHFFILLALTQEKLQTILANSSPINYHNTRNVIPEWRYWIVTMWHFGRDSLIEYSGKGISYSVETAQNILTRLYVKDFNGKNRVRIERQEYPRMSVEDAIEEKLSKRLGDNP